MYLIALSTWQYLPCAHILYRATIRNLACDDIFTQVVPTITITAERYSFIWLKVRGKSRLTIYHCFVLSFTQARMTTYVWPESCSLNTIVS